MITLKVTITGKNATTERALRRKITDVIDQQNRGEFVYETVEETVPLTLELAAQRVIEHYPKGAAVQVDQMRRVLDGEYVCVPVEPAP